MPGSRILYYHETRGGVPEEGRPLLEQELEEEEEVAGAGGDGGHTCQYPWKRRIPASRCRGPGTCDYCSGLGRSARPRATGRTRNLGSRSSAMISVGTARPVGSVPLLPLLYYIPVNIRNG